jgi:hypothetical protein
VNPNFRWRAAALPAVALSLLAGLASAQPCRAQDPPPPPPPPPEAGGGPETPAPQPPTDPGAPPPPPEAGTGTPTTPQQTPAPTGGQQGGRYLLLPDISLVGILLGHSSNDGRDPNRDKFRLDQAEIGIQSYLYPGVHLDTFTTVDGNGGGATVEEAYLTFQNVSLAKLPMSAVAGRRKVPFGRVNQLHPHSWLYIVQPTVLNNLVAGESLNGDGGYLSYLLPTKGLFAQFDAGFWSLSESPEDIEAQQDPNKAIVTSPGVGFKDKFGTGRLLLAKEALGGSFELGGSVAGGKGERYDLSDALSVDPKILLTGADLTFRREGAGATRTLLRAEYVHHRQEDGSFKRSTDGYYLFADRRVDPLTSFGVRYDDSGFPFADGRQRSISLIGTKALTEQTYFRLQLIGGSRPDKKNFGEIWAEIVFGAGPHTHNLE